jgi:hypothetical protein
LDAAQDPLDESSAGLAEALTPKWLEVKVIGFARSERDN